MDNSKLCIRVAEPYGEKHVTVFGTEAAGPEAKLAFDLLEKWGLVACGPDGYDESGRQKLRMLSPAEMVSRAFDTAACAFQEARQRGLVATVPDLNEVNAEKDAKQAEKERAKGAQS